MKTLLILVSLVVIFVIGGIGMFITIPNAVDSQKDIEPKQSKTNSENKIIRHIFSSGEEWAIEYEIMIYL